MKELSRSKWSNDLDEDETEGSEAVKGNLNALSGLIQAYGKKGKSVRWSDQVFSYTANVLNSAISWWLLTLLLFFCLFFRVVIQGSQ